MPDSSDENKSPIEADRVSQFFSDMLELSLGQGVDHDAPVTPMKEHPSVKARLDLPDVSPAHLKVFLDFLHNRPTFSTSPYPDLMAALSIAEKYECHGAIERIMLRCRNHIQGNA